MIGFRHPDTLRRLNFKHPATWLATWGGSGLILPAPGTWGTLAGLPFGIFILMTGGVPVLLTATIAVFLLGLWSANHFEKMIREKDSGMIVIDEVAGLWVAMIPCLLTPSSILTAFILFRVFDILKPWPISYFDKNFRGAPGVMIDDIIAGIFAALVITGARYVGIF